MKVKLYYLPSNNGDGSVSVRFFSSAEKLAAYQTAEENSPYFEGWGEDCSSSVSVDVYLAGNITGGRRLDPVYEVY